MKWVSLWLEVEHGKGRGEPVEAPEAGFQARLRLGAAALGAMRLVEQSPQRGDLLLELALLGGGVGKIEALAGKVAHLDDDGAPGGAAVHLDIAVALRAQHQVEGLAALGQRIDGVIEVLRRGRVEPAGEIQQRGRVARHPERRRQARHQQFGLARFRHDHQRLRLGREQRLERALAHAVALGLDLGGGFGLARTLGGAQASDRRADGKSDNAENDAERQQGTRIKCRGFARGKSRAQGQRAERNGTDQDAAQHFWPP